MKLLLVPSQAGCADGVVDYASNLVQNGFLDCRDVLFLFGKKAGYSLRLRHPNVVYGCESYRRLLYFLVSKKPDTVVVEYSPFGYSGLGAPIGLLLTLFVWHRLNRNRLVIRVHELWSCPKYFSLFGCLQVFHRYLLTLLLSEATLILCSTRGYQKTLMKDLVGKEIRFTPVATNIPARIKPPSFSSRSDHVVLFGKPDKRIETLKRALPGLCYLRKVSTVYCLQIVGPYRSIKEMELEKKLISEMLPELEVVQHGFISRDRVSRVLSTSKYAIYGDTPESLTKSGVFMAYAAHGNCILTVQDFSSSEFVDIVVDISSGTNLLLSNKPCGGEDIAERCYRMYEESFDWRHISAQYDS